jgi:hypothetical protein
MPTGAFVSSVLAVQLVVVFTFVSDVRVRCALLRRNFEVLDSQPNLHLNT